MCAVSVMNLVRLIEVYEKDAGVDVETIIFVIGVPSVRGIGTGTSGLLQ